MVKLYEDREKGIVNAELFDSWAKKEAERLQNLPPTQFRRFFGELRALEARIRSLGDDDEAFRKVKPYLNLLFAKVHYQTRDRDKRKAQAYKELERMLRDLFAELETRQDFNVAMDAAQAVLAYFVPQQGKKGG